MRLLTIDGMSSAALQIRLIKAYEEACPGFLRSIDCFAGASDGGYTALFLAANVTDDDPANLKMLDEAIAFSDALVPLFHVSLPKGLKFITGWWPLLTTQQFVAVLDQYLGDTTLGDLTPRIIITSFGAFTWKPYLFTNLEEHGRPTIPRRGSPSMRLAEIAQATSAMPLALPLYGKGRDRMVDGGWVANNTSMLAMSEICAAEASVSGADPADVMRRLKLLSLGSQESFSDRSRILKMPEWPFRKLWERNDWGYKQWFLRRPTLLMEMFLQGQINLAHFEVGGLLPANRYRRIEPPLAGLADLFRLMVGRPGKLIESFNEEAERLVNTQPWFDQQVAWIREHYLSDAT